MDERRLKIFRIAAELMLGLFTWSLHEYNVTKGTGLPEDATIVDVKWDGVNGHVDYIIHSKEFPVLGELESPNDIIIPEIYEYC